MTITAETLVAREVYYCVSHLVSTLAAGQGGIGYAPEMRALEDACQQAAELAYPIDDWAEAAEDAGWRADRANGRFVNDEQEYDYSSDWRDLCEANDIEPYQREVFEHWIVSDWLADRLAEKGEKVDKDFAGLIVWARTTTGQGIASDSVIEQIVAELNAA